MNEGQNKVDELVKLIRIYFQLDEIVDFALVELGDNEVTAKISGVKDDVRKVIERMIS
ncbi:hypothetical protein STK_13105 [Sulfurisphaera tokodaii str. 7]|uniref:Uncharacterized protein n=1 Tax=Sulfurisphaera tokodaii (strain DSM 16993 / JCM 10545 / NBRC 100140 / 7) TaxID=273063 RepID=Q971Q7_SULTO|nr:hypothetical protein [Sulfurisphaera tokodaii]BAB66363.1 hypothetical protein STK_13105 [Sulfurisphaera tokodaii str. 7]